MAKQSLGKGLGALIKTKYDPKNMFRFGFGIEPVG